MRLSGRKEGGGVMWKKGRKRGKGISVYSVVSG